MKKIKNDSKEIIKNFLNDYREDKFSGFSFSKEEKEKLDNGDILIEESITLCKDEINPSITEKITAENLLSHSGFLSENTTFFIITSQPDDNNEINIYQSGIINSTDDYGASVYCAYQ